MSKKIRSPKDVEDGPRRSGTHFVTKHDLAKLKEYIMIEFETLTAQVQANTDTEASAILLIQGIAAQLALTATDPAAVAALAAKLKSSADNLAAAVVANTPAQ